MSSHPTTDGDGELPVAHFSCAHLPPRDRYPTWREGSLLSFGRLYDTTPLVPFAVETTSVQLGAIGFSHSRMSSQEWHRTADHVRIDEADPLMVAIRFEGAGHGDANGHAFDAPPGSIVLTDFAQPQSYFSETASTAVLAIPRQLAERTLPRVRTLHGLVIPPPTALLLRSHAAAMIAALDAGMDARHAPRLGNVALDLLEIAVAQSTRDGLVSRHAAVTGARLAAEAVIERRLGSRTLSPDDVCRWSGVSRTALYKLFEPDGGVQAYIRDRRLTRVEEELRRGTPERLFAIAERWGFADAAHFSRAFRAKFGRSPRDHRAALGAASDGGQRDIG